MTKPDNIRLRRDGSIDTAYYRARGRQMRGEAAHDLTRRSTEGAKALGAWVVTVAVILVCLPLIGAYI